MNAWFRYERTNGRYCPVVLYGEKPRVPKGEEERFTVAVRAPMFGRLQAVFPAPVVMTDG
jgi:hypothetical protein